MVCRHTTIVFSQGAPGSGHGREGDGNRVGPPGGDGHHPDGRAILKEGDWISPALVGLGMGSCAQDPGRLPPPPPLPPHLQTYAEI